MHALRPVTASPRLLSLLTICEGMETMTLIDMPTMPVAVPVKSEVLDVAADIGNGQSVVIVGDTMVVLPSAVSMVGASSYQLFSHRQLPAGSWKFLAKDDHVFQWADSEVETFVGELALDARESSTARGSNSRYVDGWTLPLILSAIANARPGENTITVRLATGVPAKLWGQIAPHVEATLKKTHAFKYNGRDMRVTIREVLVEQEGPVLLDVLPEKFRQGKCIIIDIGERTTNVALFRDGDLRSATTKEFGVGGVMDDITKALLSRGWREPTPVERAGLRGALIDGGSYFYTVDNKPQRIDQIARSYFENGARALVRELRAIAPIDQADHRAAVSGGVYFMGATLAREIPGLWTPERDSEFLTARAYAARLGMTVKKGKRSR